MHCSVRREWGYVTLCSGFSRQSCPVSAAVTSSTVPSASWTVACGFEEDSQRLNVALGTLVPCLYRKGLDGSISRFFSIWIIFEIRGRALALGSMFCAGQLCFSLSLSPSFSKPPTTSLFRENVLGRPEETF